MGRGKRRKKSRAPPPSLAILPFDVISHIYSFCTASPLCSLSATCTVLRSYAKKEIIRAKIEKGVLQVKEVSGADNGRTRLVPTQCPACNKQCNSKSRLTSHINQSTTCFLPYKCPMCNMSYFSKNSRLQHMRQYGHHWTPEQLAEKKKIHDKKLVQEQKEKDKESNNNNSKSATNKPANNSKNITESPEIKLNMLKIGEEIGEGPGIVYKGTLNSKNVSVMNLRGVTQARHLSFGKTAISLRKIQNPFLVPFVGTCQSNRNYHVVYEYSEGINLYEYIKLQKSGKRLSVEAIRTIATDIAQGLKHLYSLNPPIPHGDIRTVNILVQKDHHAKLINYGLNKLYPRGVHNDAVAYMAPELRSNSSPLHEASDVYSFGVMLSAMVMAAEPFEELNAYQIAYLVNMRTKRLCESLTAAEGLHHLIKKCWSDDMLCRPRFKRIVKTMLDPNMWK